MLITSAALATIFLGLKTTLNKAIASDEDGVALHQLLTMESSSDGKVEQYPFLGDLPLVEEADEGNQAKVHNLIPSDFSIPNVDFKRTIGIKENDLKDDKLGIYTQRITETGEATRRTLDYTLARRMVAGFTTLKDYTGKAYFDSGKVINKGSTVTFTNKGTKKLSAGNYEAAIQSIGERTDAQGVSLNLGGSKTILVVGSKYRATALNILEAQLIANGGTNVNYKASDLKVWGYLDQLAPDAWFLFAFNQARKPFIKQIRQKFESSMTTDPNDSHVLKHEEYLFKIKGRMNIGAGDSLFAYGSTGADAA